MPSSNNVFAAFAERAAQNPSADALIFTDMTMSYGQLKRLAIAFSIHMANAGVNSNSTLMLQSADLPVVLATLFAASRLGARVLQYNDDIPLPEGIYVTHNFHTVDPAQPSPKGSIEINAGWSPTHTQGEVSEDKLDDGDVPWLFVFTSGTTGNPKFVGLSQAMVCARSKAVADEFVAGKTRFASLIPCDTRPFIARAMGALLNGAVIVGGHDVDFWIRAGVTMVSGSAGQMVPFFKNLNVSARFAIAEVLGSKPLASDVRILLNSFKIVQDVVGASEANKVFANVSTLTPDGRVVSKGVKRDTEISMVDADGNPVPPGQEGILRLKNGYLAKAYIGDPEASALAFRDGWFYPGDVASWGDEGTLRIQNRNDNVVNIRGLKVNAFAIDQIFKSVDGIRDAVCFRNPKPNAVDELFAFVVFGEGANRLQATESARFLCREKLGESMVPRIIRAVGGIPRKPDGAPDRKACADIILKMQ